MRNTAVAWQWYKPTLFLAHGASMNVQTNSVSGYAALMPTPAGCAALLETDARGSVAFTSLSMCKRRWGQNCSQHHLHLEADIAWWFKSVSSVVDVADVAEETRRGKGL